MHVAGLSLDPYWFLQFVFTAFIVALGLLHLVKNTASKYFVVDANFDEGGVSVEGNRRTGRDEMLAVAGDGDGCAVCGNSASKKCARCKLVRYCSQTCQTEHWKSIHKSECKVAKSSGAISLVPSVSDARRRAVFGDKSPSDPGHGNCTVQLSKKILFPYDEFVKLFNWDKPGFPPCGLLNCGNSCFANVVLQCLSCTRPLVAYLFEKNHRRECRRNDWCFLCELQTHVERASHLQPFSPLNILSRLPNIGGNLGHGKQEDAHEFMRFAIDTMQSVCLDEFGGERALHPSSQETTLIQHTFGGQLQSQVICTKCNKISNRYENMMDLTVEIQGDASSLEDCLDQFTAREWLDGENMYKCDGCNDYVKAWKRLTVRQAPNILTIALKRFQSGRFGKLNKKVTFPEVLDLGPYMSELGDGTNLYSLYAVVVHVDMLNASYFGHYICYTKDFRGKWYRIDDCKVVAAELEEVLAQGAYMLLYSRNRVRPPCADSVESSEKQGRVVTEAQESVHCSQAPDESLNILDSHSSVVSNTNKIIPEELSLQVGADPKPTDGVPQELHLDDPHCFSSGLEDIECHSKESNQAVVTSVDLGHKELPDLSLSSDALSAMVQSKECESSSSYAVHETSFEDGSRATNNDSNDLTLESSTEISQSIENIVQEMAEISPEVCPAASSLAGEKLDEANHASYETSPSPCLEPAVAVKTCKCSPAAAQTADGAVSRLPEAKSPCKGNLKPMFSSGFLNKNARSKSLKRPAKTDSEHSDRSSRKDDWDCSGVTKPAFSGLSTDKICEPSELSSDSRSASTTCSVRQSEDCLHGDVDMKKEACGTWDPHNDNRCNGGVVSIISVENNRNNHHRDNGREEVYENGGGQLADNCLPVQQLESNPYYKEKLNLPSSGFLHSHRSLLVPEGEGENQPGEVSSSRIVEVQCNGLVEHAHDCQNNSEANGHGQLVLYSNGTSKSRFIGQAKHSVNTDKMVRKECADVGYPQNNCSRDSVHSDEQHGSRVYNNGSAQETFCGTSRSLVVDCRNPFHSTCDDISLGKNYSNKNEESQELNETIYHLEVETDCQRLSDGRPVTSCEMAKPPKKQPLNMTLVSPKSVRQRLDPKCDCKEYLNVTLAEGGQDFKRQRHV